MTTNKALPAVWAPPVWDNARIELVRKIICPPSAAHADFEYFVAWCQRTGLDPFLRQAFLVERKAKGDNGQWHVKHEPMAAEAGMGAVADAQADFLGMASAAVYAGDQFEIDESAGTVNHKWSLEAREKAGHRCIGAWAHAKRSGRTTPLVWLRIEQRLALRWDSEKKAMVPTQFWAKDAAGMIAKCARAMAYRLCYPNLFSGVPIQEEREESDDEPRPQQMVQVIGTNGADRLAAKLGLAPKTEPQPEPVVIDQPAEPKPEPLPSITFGPSKGKLIHDASMIELEDSIALGEEKLLAAEPKAKWIPATMACLEAMRAEIKSRLMAHPED